MFFDDDHASVELRFRAARLTDARYHVHRAVEVMFRAALLVLEAFWSGVAVDRPAPVAPRKDPDTFREAA